MTFNFLGPGLTVNVEAKVKEQIILDSSVRSYKEVSGLKLRKDSMVFSCRHSTRPKTPTVSI